MKKFNVTGTCIPEKHYMVDVSDKLNIILKLVDNEEYFIINRPRQYGKTTTLDMLERHLNNIEDYLVISINFKGIGQELFKDEKMFSKQIIHMMSEALLTNNKDISQYLEEQKSSVENFMDLSYLITNLIIKSKRKVVLIIDNADNNSNNRVFSNFLDVLRYKYLLRNEEKDYTFHSVILAGVENISSLKLDLQVDGEYNVIPWNIVADFDVDMSFSIDEIKTMLEDYTENKKVDLDKEYFAGKIYFYTSGTPFLVSKLCKIIDEKILPKDKLKWEKDYLDIAVKELLKESNSNLDNLIKNIENNKELQELVRKILLDEYTVRYDRYDPLIAIGIVQGMFKDSEGIVKISSRIYKQKLYNYFNKSDENYISLELKQHIKS